MIEIYRLTKRHLDVKSENELPHELEQIKVFSTFVGHGIGTIDFSEKIDSLSDDEFDEMLKKSGKYTNFKIGNLSKYFEIEIFPEHSFYLLQDMCDCKLKNILKDHKEGFFVLRKDFKGV